MEPDIELRDSARENKNESLPPLIIAFEIFLDRNNWDSKRGEWFVKGYSRAGLMVLDQEYKLEITPGCCSNIYNHGFPPFAHLVSAMHISAWKKVSYEALLMKIDAYAVAMRLKGDEQQQKGFKKKR